MKQLTKIFVLSILSVGLTTGASGIVFAASTGASNSQTSSSDSGYSAAKAAVDAQEYDKAITLLAAVVKSDKTNADAWNLLGYSSRKLGQYDNAAKYYDAALKLDPSHLGALEYQGELFVETGQMEKAKANLGRLQEICGNCEEFVDLQQAVGTGS